MVGDPGDPNEARPRFRLQNPAMATESLPSPCPLTSTSFNSQHLHRCHGLRASSANHAKVCERPREGCTGSPSRGRRLRRQLTQP